MLMFQQRRATASTAAEGDGRWGRGNKGSQSKGEIDDDEDNDNDDDDDKFGGVASAFDDINYQVIAAEGENSAAQALRNASEVDFEFTPIKHSCWT